MQRPCGDTRGGAASRTPPHHKLAQQVGGNGGAGGGVGGDGRRGRRARVPLVEVAGGGDRNDDGDDEITGHVDLPAPDQLTVFAEFAVETAAAIDRWAEIVTPARP